MPFLSTNTPTAQPPAQPALPAPPRIISATLERRTTHTVPDYHSKAGGAQYTKVAIDHYWAVREPGYHESIESDDPRAEGTYYANHPADPGDLAGDDHYIIYGGQPVRVYNRYDIAGLRALLDAIEADMKPDANTAEDRS